jgi:hypothetical protein
VFEKQSPDAEVNKAVCYDCHGIHDIQRVDDPVSGIQIKENLLVRCKVCHPDATTNFPSAGYLTISSAQITAGFM